jgi:Ca2+-binding RTX toxin-like protein
MHILGTENPDNLTGTAGDDQIEALASDDIVHGGAGNDSLDGGSGNDQLFGGAGADDLYGGTGRDILDGGAGADLLYGGDGIDTVDYSANSTAIAVDGGRVTGGGDAAGDRLDSIESVIGTAFADTMLFSGASTLDGRGGDDILSGADTLLGGDGNDQLSDGNELLGGDGNDQLSDGHELHGGSGDDILTVSSGAGALAAGALLYGEDGDDTLVGAAKMVDGGAGTDTYQTTLTPGAINLAKGYVSSADGVGLISNVENITIDDGANVRITGNDGDNVLKLDGTGGDNVLLGGLGDDTLVGSGTTTRFFGGAGADHFDATSTSHAYFYYNDSPAGVTVDLSTGHASGGDAEGDSFTLFSGGGAFTGLIGSDFDDTLRDRDFHNAYPNATEFDSVIYGGAGDDRIIGGIGTDWLHGGSGADTFIYEKIDDTAYYRGGEDRIFDFSSAEGDKIDLSAIDADGNSANGRTPFTFIGEGDPTHTGEIGYVFNGHDLFVDIMVDVTVGPSRYATIELNGVSSVTASDFAL